MKKISLVLIMVLISTIGYSQKSWVTLSLKNPQDLYKVFDENIVDSKDFYESLCLKSLIFVKFKVNSAGKIYNIDFSTNTLPEIKSAFKETLAKSKGHWKFTPSEKKVLPSKTFIIPYAFDYRGGCPTSPMEVQNTNPTREIKEKLAILEAQVKADKTFDSLVDLLVFEKTPDNFLNCIILPVLIDRKIVLY